MSLNILYTYTFYDYYLHLIVRKQNHFMGGLLLGQFCYSIGVQSLEICVVGDGSP